jgi:predicted alpha/beta-fold hydrolase
MITESAFRPPTWLRNPHLQTLWPVAFGRRGAPTLRRERLELADGDFLDLDWTAGRTGPVVVVLHGLEGSSRSHYAAGIMRALDDAGYTAVLMHFRGCSGEPNRLARSYNAGDTLDLATVVGSLRERLPDRPVYAIGYSLGGNALLKWLGETGSATLLDAAVAVSVPFLLEECAQRIDAGLSQVYQWHLLAKMKASVRRKQALRRLNCELGDLRDIRSFVDFDDRITAPLHGYAGVADYYRRASCRSYLGGIERPTLILHAEDDPFMYPQTVPRSEELASAVTLELARHGGHVGFVDAESLRGGPSWLERRIVDWLERLR